MKKRSLLPACLMALATLLLAACGGPIEQPTLTVGLAPAVLPSPERILFDWLQSEEGQTLIKQTGYVSMAGERRGGLRSYQNRYFSACRIAFSAIGVLY